MKTPASCFRDLLVWRAAHALVLDVYQVTATFPRREIFGLTIQLRRAAVSVAANIAEGFRRRGLPEKIRFLNIAEGSLEEVRYYLILASDLRYTDGAGIISRLDEVGRMLHAYSNAIRARLNPPVS